MKAHILLMLLATLCAACAPVTRRAEFSEQALKTEENLQRGLVLEAELVQRQRLADTAFPITVAARQECAKHRGMNTGIELASSGNFNKDYAADARRLGFGDEATVATVAAASPAALAGLRRGDELLAIDGRKGWATGPHAASGATEALTQASTRGAFELKVRRADGTLFNTQLKPVEACSIAVLIYRSGKSEIRVNERAALVPYQVVRLAANRDELSAIAAFSVAAVIKELGVPRSNASPGSSSNESSLTAADDPRLVIQNVPLHAKDLKEADTYAVELMRRTGSAPVVAASFWRKMIARNMMSERDSWGTQYKDAERMAALDAASRTKERRP
jgi:hypothetical protein